MLYRHGEMKILQQKLCTHTLISKVVEEDLRLPVTKDSTRDVTGKLAQFKMVDISNFEEPL